MTDTKKAILDFSARFHKDIVAYRRHIHSNPELSFEEYKTADFVSDKLISFNIPFKQGIAKTGVVGLIKGEKPGKKVIALRADMDALPILETNKVSYKSKTDGVMHACGHDVHTASLLGTARILSGIKKHFGGTVKLIFQPSEEKIPGGASVMIKEGVLKNPKPESIYGQHVFPYLEAGEVGFKPGMFMASSDEIYITVKGKGGHAAVPHELVDPVLMASHIIIALQQLVSRNANPLMHTVLSFGKFIANGATNVIPDRVNIEGTFRTLNEDWRVEAHKKIKKLAVELAKSMGGDCDIEIRKGYPSLFNDEKLTLRSKAWAQEYVGAENVKEIPVRLTSEDFAFFSQEMPSCFYRLGTANKKKGITSHVHTSTFDIDEKALETGAGLMAYLAVQELTCKE